MLMRLLDKFIDRIFTKVKAQKAERIAQDMKENDPVVKRALEELDKHEADTLKKLDKWKDSMDPEAYHKLKELLKKDSNHTQE